MPFQVAEVFAPGILLTGLLLLPQSSNLPALYVAGLHHTISGVATVEATQVPVFPGARETSPIDLIYTANKADTGSRPIPTPARALPFVMRLESAPTTNADGCHHEIDDHAQVTVHDSLLTLLETSVRDPSSTAFFMTATLLDTLVEHFGPPEGHQSHNHAAVPISLLETLPAPVFEIDVNNVALPHQNNLLARLFARWTKVWTLPNDIDCTEWPGTTRDAIATLPSWPELLCREAVLPIDFALYTDGSADLATQTSGYAVIILAHTPAGTALLGAFGAQLAGNPCSPWEAEGPLALHAEHVAIAVALLWTMQQRGTLPAMTCAIRFDCTAAGWSAEGSWQPSGSTARIVHHLDMVARATPGIHLSYAHVKGHSGNPWNDLADHVAKSVARGQTRWPEPPADLCCDICGQDLSWLAPEQDARSSSPGARVRPGTAYPG